MKGNRISVVEARHIALQTLAEAEQRREEAAHADAARFSPPGCPCEPVPVMSIPRTKKAE